MPKDSLSLSGELRIVLRGKDGKEKDHRDCKNLVVDVGLEFIASRVLGASKAVMSHMGVGSGTAAAAAGDTALQSDLGPRVALMSSSLGGSDAKKVEYVANFPAGTGTGSVTEAGVFNADSGGDMLCRTVFDPVNKAPDDSMTITWVVTVGA